MEKAINFRRKYFLGGLFVGLFYCLYVLLAYLDVSMSANQYRKELHFATDIAPVYCLINDRKQNIDSLKVAILELQRIADSIQGISDYIEHLESFCRQLNRASQPLDSLLPSLIAAEQSIQSATPYDDKSQLFHVNMQDLLNIAVSLAGQIQSGSNHCQSGNFIGLTTKMMSLKSTARRVQDQILRLELTNAGTLIKNPFIAHLSKRLNSGLQALDNDIQKYPFIPQKLIKGFVLGQLMPKKARKNAVCIQSLIHKTTLQ